MAKNAVISSNSSHMIGRRCPEGPGGRDCACCGEAPGAGRKAQRRTAKRSERQAVKRAIRDELR